MYYAIINTQTQTVIVITSNEQKSLEYMEHCKTRLHPVTRAKCGIGEFIEYLNGANITTKFIVKQKQNKNGEPYDKHYVKYSITNHNH